MKTYKNAKLTKKGRITIGIMFFAIGLILALIEPLMGEGIIFFYIIGLIFIFNSKIRILIKNNPKSIDQKSKSKYNNIAS